MATEFRASVEMDLYTESDEIDPDSVHDALRDYLKLHLVSRFHVLRDSDGIGVPLSVETIGQIDVYAL